MSYLYHLPADPPPPPISVKSVANSIYRYFKPRELECPEFVSVKDAKNAFARLPLTSDNLLIFQTVLFDLGEAFDSRPLVALHGMKGKVITYSRKRCRALTHTITFLANGELLPHPHRSDKVIYDAKGRKHVIEGKKQWKHRGGYNYLYPCGKSWFSRVPRKDEWGHSINHLYHLEIDAAQTVLAWGAGVTDGKRVYVPQGDGGSVIDLLQKGIPVPPCAFLQLAKGLAFIHMVGAHRDIKIDNAIFHMGVARWVDLGFFFRGEHAYASRGTPTYLDPELHRKITCEGGASLEDTKSGDIWAFGLMMWIMMHPKSGVQPFREKVSPRRLIFTPITKFDAPDTPMNGLIRRMITLPLDERPKIGEVVETLTQILKPRI